MNAEVVVLGIESSCDETGVALYHSSQGVIGETLRSQADLHANYGGVVPEIASRDHIRHILPLVNETFRQAQLKPADVGAVAYTVGPGLVGALFVGACVGRSLAYAWDKVPIGVHHLEGHILSALMEPEKPEYPFVCLLVSGGHSQLILVNAWSDYRLLGESLDDAAGEAFDKVAKMLDLGYPGGPKVAQLAEAGRPVFEFPRPMVDRPGLDMSFSGLKTAVLNRVHQMRDSSGALSHQAKADIACAFETAIVETLLIKIKRALERTQVTNLVLAGGVAANQSLRRSLASALGDHIQCFFPRSAWCTDNAAMIAFAGYQCLHGLNNQAARADLGVRVHARWPLESYR